MSTTCFCSKVWWCYFSSYCWIIINYKIAQTVTVEFWILPRSSRSYSRPFSCPFFGPAVSGTSRDSFLILVFIWIMCANIVRGQMCAARNMTIYQFFLHTAVLFSGLNPFNWQFILFLHTIRILFPSLNSKQVTNYYRTCSKFTYCELKHLSSLSVTSVRAVFKHHRFFLANDFWMKHWFPC